MVERPTHYVGMIEGRLPRHCLATPPVTLIQAFRGRTPSVTLREYAPFLVALVRLWGHTPFPVRIVRFLGQLCRFRFIDWAHIPHNLVKTTKVGICISGALPGCRAGSAQGHRTSVSAIPPNCTKVRRRATMDVLRRRTDVVLEGVALTFPLVDPWPIYIVALIMVKVFLGVSDGGQGVCAEENYPSECQNYKNQGLQ